tara:strand:- start:159 stop:395 length:237 start_codon:yes stop_codon:yes gene_type:complete
MDYKKKQINCRVSEENYEKLLSMSNHYKYSHCPTCNKAWDHGPNVRARPPIPFSVLAGYLLDDAIEDYFNKQQFGGPN